MNWAQLKKRLFRNMTISNSIHWIQILLHSLDTAHWVMFRIYDRDTAGKICVHAAPSSLFP
jgi:hypothetical protein